MHKEKLVIVGIFYDGYEDVWGDFLHCFKKFWEKCPYNFYIVNNEKKLSDFDNVSWINAGKDAEYSKKVQTAIKNIDADYYLLMLEDFFFSKHLSKDVLEPIIAFIEKENLDYYCLSSLSSFTKYKSDLYDNDFDYLYKVNPNYRYTLGCQAVIWKKEFLKKCIGKRNYNAWVFEGALAKSKNVHTKEFLSKSVKDDRNILGLKHGILQQKMIPTTIEYYKAIGYPLTTNRVMMTKEEYRKYVFISRLTAYIPRFLYSFIKKLIKKNNNSVLDKYESEIEAVIKENFGE